MARQKAVVPKAHLRTAFLRKRRAPATPLRIALALIWPEASFMYDDPLFLSGIDSMGQSPSLRGGRLGLPSERTRFARLPPTLKLLLTIPAKTRGKVFRVLERFFHKEIERLKWEGSRGPRNIGDPRSKRYADYQKFLEYQRKGYRAREIADKLWPPTREYAPGEQAPKDPEQLINNWRRRARQRGDLPPVRE